MLSPTATGRRRIALTRHPYLKLGVLSTFALASFLWGAEPRRWRPSKRFACYYGEAKVEPLAAFDLAIVEPSRWTADQVQALRKSGTKVIGYLSVGEELPPPGSPSPVPPSGSPGPSPAGPSLVLAPYFLDRNGDGTPDRNGDWGSFYVDARAVPWRQKVLASARNLIEKQGYDGLFLDTLDTVDAYPETTQGMTSLVAELRAAFPGHALVANRGFTLMDSMRPLVDAVLFEAFTTRYDPGTGRSRLHPKDDLAWVDAMLAKVRGPRGDGPQVLVLDYADPKDPAVARQARDRAKAAGLVFSLSVGTLDRLPLPDPD